MTDPSISEEAARDQLDLLLDFYDIDLNGIDDEQLSRVMNSNCSKLVRSIMKGRVEIVEKDDTVVVKQYLKRPIKGVDNPIEYKEITGRAKIAMKDYKDTDYYGRMYALLGSLSGVGASSIMAMKGVDLSVAECLCSVFLLQ